MSFGATFCCLICQLGFGMVGRWRVRGILLGVLLGVVQEAVYTFQCLRVLLCAFLCVLDGARPVADWISDNPGQDYLESRSEGRAS